MGLFTIEQLQSRAKDNISKRQGSTRYFSESEIIEKAHQFVNESLLSQKAAPSTKTWDIFLSHSTNDARLIEGLKSELEDLGYSVYIDWIDDPKLDRRQVTKETALKLQERMRNCKSLFYAFTENSPESRWMPWELGYFDGVKNKAAVLPISNSNKGEYRGTEYLGMYYYITKEGLKNSTEQILWVNESADVYCQYNNWINGTATPRRHS